MSYFSQLDCNEQSEKWEKLCQIMLPLKDREVIIPQREHPHLEQLKFLKIREVQSRNYLDSKTLAAIPYLTAIIKDFDWFGVDLMFLASEKKLNYPMYLSYHDIQLIISTFDEEHPCEVWVRLSEIINPV